MFLIKTGYLDRYCRNNDDETYSFDENGHKFKRELPNMAYIIFNHFQHNFSIHRLVKTLFIKVTTFVLCYFSIIVFIFILQNILYKHTKMAMPISLQRSY